MATEKRSTGRFFAAHGGNCSDSNARSNATATQVALVQSSELCLRGDNCR